MAHLLRVVTLVSVTLISGGCAWFGEERAVGKPPAMLLVTTARSSGSEISLSRIALERSSNPEVKQFAQQAMADHEQMNQEIRALADRRHISVMPVPDEVNQTVAAHLRKLSGLELDRAYMSEMLAEHSKMAAKFETAVREENDPEVQRWAEKQIPTVQKHLEMAQRLNEKLIAAR
jgi:putative membrane protein